MKNKKRILASANSILLVILAIAIAIMLNVIVSQNTLTIDLTENQMYTLSNASLNAVKNLEEDIVIKAYISPNMPAPLHTLTQSIEDLLQDYASASNGKLSYQIISPQSNDEKAEEDARSHGIEKVGIGQRTDDEVSLRAVYKGIAFIKGEKTEVIKDLRTSGNAEFDNFEYEFTKSLLNLRSEKSQEITFLSGFGGPAGEPAFLQSIQPMFARLYGNLVTISVIDLSVEKTKIPKDTRALIILNIDKTVSEHAKFAIDQYLQNGGSLGWFQSASGPDFEMIQKLSKKLGTQGQLPDVRKIHDTGLNSFFTELGIQLNQDVILDREKGLAMGYIQTEKGRVQVSHPATFLLENLDRNLPFVAMLPGLVLPAASSVTIHEKLRTNKEIEIYEIAKTAKNSVQRSTPPETLNYRKFMTPEPGERPGEFIVAAALRGKLSSYYENNALPEGINENELTQTNAKSRLLIVGSGDFFLPNPQIGFSDQLAGLGAQFLLSSIEWLAQNNELGEIRGKKAPRLIGEVSKENQRRIQFANVVAVPSLFAFLGILIAHWRRRRKETFKI